MKVLFLCPYKVTKTLGGAKVYIEAAEGFKKAGWEVDILGPDDLDPQIKITDMGLAQKCEHYPPLLKKTIIEKAKDYDVIEFDHLYLPYERSELPKNVLLVARSILLIHHSLDIEFPIFFTLRSVIGKIVNSRKNRKQLNKLVSMADKTLHNCDLINVTNEDDKNRLIQQGFTSDKIEVFSYGLYPERVAQLNVGQTTPPNQDTIVFIGTFDNRKGAVEFPKIVNDILKSYPNCKFKLLGTSAMFPTQESVLNVFPKHTHHGIEVFPNFKSEELGNYLQDCTLGIFPSHLESFGFGVIEMMAASLPVIAYKTPGPPIMLTEEYLVPRGDYKALVDKVLQLLGDKKKLEEARAWSKQRVNDFNWETIAKETANTYQRKIEG